MERKCSRCGAPAGADDRFCGRCGAPLPEGVPPGGPRRPAWRPILWTWIPLAAAAAVLVLTNPSPRAYARWLAGQVVAGARRPALAASAADLTAAIARGTVAQNDVIFTIFDTRLRGVRVDVLGILDRFVTLTGTPAD